MRLTITIILFCFSIMTAGNAEAKGSISQIINVLIENKLLDDAYNDDSQLGQKVCEAFDGSCYIGMRISQGIDQFNQNFKDREWAWDQFYHSTGSLVWACRGVQTGQFADLSGCSGKSKNDYRWPNK